MPIEIKVDRDDSVDFLRQWTLGSCSGPTYNGTSISSTTTYYDRCCLTPGQYTLTCHNVQSKYGWGNATFEIDGKGYCDDFVGFKAMRTLFVKGRVYQMSYNVLTTFFNLLNQKIYKRHQLRNC